MDEDINFDEIINKYRSDPYEYLDVVTPHTGRVKFKVSEGEKVDGPSGKWSHHPGTLLYILNRENNPKPIYSLINGVVSSLREEREEEFVEAGERLILQAGWGERLEEMEEGVAEFPLDGKSVPATAVRRW